MPELLSRTASRTSPIDLNRNAASKLNLYSLRRLELLLGVSREELKTLAGQSGAHYKPFPQLPKPQPFARIFKVQKLRNIDNPDDELKRVQKRIYRRLLRPLVLPHYICGGVPGRSLMDNVRLHHNSRILVTIDIKSFFPSISNFQIFFVWRHVLNCSTEIADLLTKLTTWRGYLPQGASTSTPLANIVICSMYRHIQNECERLGILYSTWIDDLAFSGERAREIIPVVISVLQKNGFKISRKKLRVMGGGSRKVLNGVVLGKFPSVRRERESQIRSGIHKHVSGAVAEEDICRYLKSLNAKIMNIETINAMRGAKLRKAFSEALTRRPVPRSRWQELGFVYPKAAFPNSRSCGPENVRAPASGAAALFPKR